MVVLTRCRWRIQTATSDCLPPGFITTLFYYFRLRYNPSVQSSAIYLSERFFDHDTTHDQYPTSLRFESKSRRGDILRAFLGRVERERRGCGSDRVFSVC